MSTVSGMVVTAFPELSYTVTVWRYIMFCAKTRPVSEAATDLGEIGPPMVWMRLILRTSDGGPAGIRLKGETVVVEVGERVGADATATGFPGDRFSDAPARRRGAGQR
jgi:hypothetical protein